MRGSKGPRGPKTKERGRLWRRKKTAVPEGIDYRGAGELARALCRALVAEGVELVLLDRSLAELEAVAAELGAGARCLCHEIDLTDLEGAETLFREIVAAHDDVDLLVLNAGIDVPQSIDAFDWRIAKRHLDVNTIANYVALAVLLPHFKRRGTGHVVGIVSLGAGGLPCEHAYNASKAAFSMMLDGLRSELRGSGVKFTCLCIRGICRGG